MGRSNGVYCLLLFSLFVFLQSWYQSLLFCPLWLAIGLGKAEILGFMGFSDTGRMVLGAMKDGLFLILCSSLWVDCVMFIPPRRGRNETTLVYYSIS